jgi:hypothetical protein
MTNAEEEARELFEQFIEVCEKNNIPPQLIMYQSAQTVIFDMIRDFWGIRKEDLELDD